MNKYFISSERKSPLIIKIRTEKCIKFSTIIYDIKNYVQKKLVLADFFIFFLSLTYISISNAQNIGISNDNTFTNPQSPLHIYWSSDGNLLQLSRSSAANTGLTFSVSSNDYSILNRQNNALILGTNAIERMRISNDGNVLINTNSLLWSTDLVEILAHSTYYDLFNVYNNHSIGTSIFSMNSNTNGLSISTTGGFCGLWSDFSNTLTGTAYSKPGACGIIADGAGHDFSVATQAYRYSIYAIFPDANNYSRRSAAVLGYFNDSYMSALAYVRGNGAVFGLLYVGGMTTATKSDKSNNTVNGIGFGGWGGVLGGFTHGKIFGFINKGKYFASYSIGNSYIRNGTYKTIIETVNRDNDNVIILDNILTDGNKVYIDGKTKLVNGKAQIDIDERISQILDDYNIIVTPYGACNGVYVDSVTECSFIIKELNNGKSNGVKVSYIIIGTIKSELLSNIPTFLKSKKFHNQLEKVIEYDDNEALPMWWDGNNVRFDNCPIIKRDKDLLLNQYSNIRMKKLNKNFIFKK